MAGEGRVSFALKVQKSNLVVPNRRFNYTFDVGGDAKFSNVYTIGFASWTNLSIATDFGTPGVGWFTNHDATNYVELGPWNAGSPLVWQKILPGESFPIRFGVAKTELAAKFDTASGQLELMVVEE